MKRVVDKMVDAKGFKYHRYFLYVTRIVDEHRPDIPAKHFDVNGRFVGWDGVYGHFVLTARDNTVLKKGQAGVDMWKSDVANALFTPLTKHIKTVHIGFQ